MKLPAVTILKTFSAAACLTAAAGAAAQTNTPPPLSYDFAGLKYTNQDLGDYDCSQDGLSVYGSMDINSGWYGQASYTDVSGNNDCGSSTIAGYGGYRQPLNDIFYLYGHLGFESTSVDYGNSDSGLAAGVGIRGFIRPQLETQLDLTHHTSFDGATQVTGTLAYWFVSNIAATADLSLGEDTVFSIGARVNF